MERQWEVELLRCIMEVQEQVIDDVHPRVVFDNLLSHLLALTESDYGFIGQVLHTEAGAPYLKTHAISDISWNEETRAFYAKHAPQGMEFHNMETLFGAAITSENTVISNAPAQDDRSGGLPRGHPPLSAFLGVPFHRRDKLIGMFGVANRIGGYDEQLVHRMKPFLAVCASTIEAFTNQRERKKAEAALLESEKRYRRLVEDQPELLCRFTPDRSLTFVNRAYAEHFGRTVAECEGLDFLELIPESDHDTVCQHLASMGKERPITRYEHQVFRASGEIGWMQWTDRALFNEHGEIIEFQSIGLDITERKHAEEHRHKLEAQLRQVQKLESLGVLAGGIAHDFNNLLTGILGNASLARMQLPSESPATGNMDDIETAAQRASELCSQMLTYSGRATFETRSVNLSDLVREMVQMLELSISKKAVLELDVPVDLPTIQADATQIRQVVMNLITNASDALGGGVGTIRVETGVRQCDRVFLQQSYLHDELPAGPYVYVQVTDDGAGLDRHTAAKIFDPFFSTKFTGRGLGLAAVLGIVRGHRGAIRVDSEPGSGTTMTILLPASTHLASVQGKERPQPEKSARTGLVLVIDDEQAVRNVARRSLEAFGFDVVLATNGREGLETYRERAHEISIILVDLTMPVLGGDEVLHEVRQIRPDARVILSSGYSEHDVATRFAGLKPSAFLHKPYGPQELLASIDASFDSNGVTPAGTG